MAPRPALFPRVCVAAGLPEPEAEYRFAPPRRWRLLDVVKWCHGATWKTRNALVRNLRREISAESIRSAVLLWTVRGSSVSCAEAEADRAQKLRPMRRNVQGSLTDPSFSTVLLAGLSEGHARVSSPTGTRWWPWQGLVEEPADRLFKSLLERGCRWLSGFTSSCLSGTRPTVSMFAMWHNGPATCIRLGQLDRELSRRDRLCRDVPVLPLALRP